MHHPATAFPLNGPGVLGKLLVPQKSSALLVRNGRSLARYSSPRLSGQLIKGTRGEDYRRKHHGSLAESKHPPARVITPN